MHRFQYAAAVALALVWTASATAQTNSKEIMALPEAKLIEILKSADAPIFDKAKACQRLAVIGTKEAIPALAALLPDEKLNLYARFGLEAIPDPAVDAALREAAGKLQGRPLVGVIDSIGQRRDGRAVELLKSLLKHPDLPVASAAAGALGRIATTEAARAIEQALTTDTPVKNSLGDAGLACAEGLAAAGKTADAIRLYDAVRAANVAQAIKVAALGRKSRLVGAGAIQIVLAQLKSTDQAEFQLGLALARELDAPGLTAALIAVLDQFPLDRQALVLLALSDRKEPLPPRVALAAAKSPSAQVREAAIRVLAKHGDAAAVAVLLDAALGEGQAAAAAREGLKSIPGQEVDAAVAARLAKADAKAKAVLFELVGARRIAAAEPAVRAALDDPNQSVRLAAVAAMGQLAELKDLDLLLSRALRGEQADETTAQRALRTAALRMSDRDATAARLGEALKSASGGAQEFLLELLSKVSGPKALAIVAAATKSSDPALKDAATRVLGNWVNADAAPALLEIAQHDPDAKYQIRALRGYIRIARQLQIPEAKRLEMFRTAMEVARRPDEKRLALAVLTRIPSARTLELAASYLEQPDLKDAAAQAALDIAPKILGTSAPAVSKAMQRVLAAGVANDNAARAKQLLGQSQSATKP